MIEPYPAPNLRETADIWWDSGTDPVILWDDGGSFWLADGADHALRLHLVDAPEVPPEAVAAALHEGLAACDFPPTDNGVPMERAQATLRAAGL